jgi:DNA-binding transcriptional LysR family regulator
MTAPDRAWVIGSILKLYHFLAIRVKRIGKIKIIEISKIKTNMLKFFMDLHQLKIFVSVYKNKSFSKASEQLYLTQPTISDHIKSLEEELECKLFDRLGRTIIPTKEADFLYSHAILILEKVDLLKESFTQFKKEISGELIIGASTIPGTYLMPKIISNFKEKYPSVIFQIIIGDSKDIVDKISDHELLIGIVGAKVGNSNLSFIPFMDDELIVVASPDMIKEDKITLRELIEFPLIFREIGSGTRKEVENILESNGISAENLKISGIFGSTDAVKQAVKNKLGISILSKLSVHDELIFGTLKEITISDIQMKRKFYLVTHNKRSLPLVYNIFLDYIKAHHFLSE